jgi:hypothetical protein
MVQEVVWEEDSTGYRSTAGMATTPQKKMALVER